MSQLSFGFEVPEGHVEPDVPRKRPASRRKSAPVQAATQLTAQVNQPGSGHDTLAKMADTLAAHPVAWCLASNTPHPNLEPSHSVC